MTGGGKYISAVYRESKAGQKDNIDYLFRYLHRVVRLIPSFFAAAVRLFPHSLTVCWMI